MVRALEYGGRKYVHEGKILKIYTTKDGKWQFYLGCQVKRPDKIISRETGLSASEIAEMWQNVT